MPWKPIDTLLDGLAVVLVHIDGLGLPLVDRLFDGALQGMQDP